MKKPNLFDYATSELSQDAFFAWLIAWADKAYSGTDMHICGRAFLNTVLLGGTGKSLPNECQVVVKRQYKSIDVFCRIDDDFAIIIEDKIWTKEHSDQLTRYREEIIAEGYAEDKIVGIYLKPFEQSDLSSIEKAGYRIVDREKLLAFFRLPQTQDAMRGNAILADFAENIAQIEQAVASYLTKPLADWDWRSWVGFFVALQGHINGQWDYVPNPSGGFMGFWWGFEWVDGGEVYLQLEENRACFKATVYDMKDAEELKWRWNTAFKDAGAALGIDVVHPSRLRKGGYMTVAVLNGDSRVAKPDGTLDMEATLSRLETMEKVLAYAIAHQKDEKQEGAEK